MEKQSGHSRRSKDDTYPTFGYKAVPTWETCRKTILGMVKLQKQAVPQGRLPIPQTRLCCHYWKWLYKEPHQSCAKSSLVTTCKAVTEIDDWYLAPILPSTQSCVFCTAETGKGKRDFSRLPCSLPSRGAPTPVRPGGTWEVRMQWKSCGLVSTASAGSDSYGMGQWIYRASIL
jgi:hypothetical protein